MEFSVNIEKIDYTCRTCLANNGPFLNLIESNHFHLFTQLTQLEVSAGDKLPQIICQCCIDVLKSIENFIDKCKVSDKFLHEALSKLSSNDDSQEEVLFDFSPKSYMNEEKEDSLSSKPSEQRLQKRGKCKRNEKKEEKSSIQKPSTCGSCGGEYYSKKELKEHYTQSKTCKENEFKCNNCYKIFSKRHKLEAHMRCHTKESPFQCKICLKNFRFSQNLRRHRKGHEGIKPFICHICNKAFSRAILKEEHLRTHTGETPFICKYCGKGFKRYNSHHIHITRHQIENGELPDDQKEFYKQMECKRCNKKFSSKSALRAHEVIHTGEKMFLCNECGKDFFTKGALQSHYKVHSGVKPHQCPKCEKSFSQKGGLKNHILTHMGMKPYSCNICSKSFVQSTHLKNHMRTHSGERPYVCSFCNKSFALNCNLKVHIRTHTGETPFRCPLCGMGFYDSSSMKKHKKGHSPSEDGQKEDVANTNTDIPRSLQINVFSTDKKPLL